MTQANEQPGFVGPKAVAALSAILTVAAGIWSRIDIAGLAWLPIIISLLGLAFAVVTASLGQERMRRNSTILIVPAANDLNVARGSLILIGGIVIGLTLAFVFSNERMNAISTVTAAASAALAFYVTAFVDESGIPLRQYRHLLQSRSAGRPYSHPAQADYPWRED